MAGLALAAMIVLAAGCKRETRTQIGFYMAPGGIPAEITRVAFVPMTNLSEFPTATDGMGAALAQAVQATKLFHFEVASPADSLCTCLPRDPKGQFSLKQLSELRRSLACDAILVGAVTQFEPYPHMQGGLYLRLVDVRTGRLIWSVDHVWDTADEKVRKRIQAFFEHELGKTDDPLKWRLATVSTQAFDRYVAFEVAETLPKLTADRTSALYQKQAGRQKL